MAEENIEIQDLQKAVALLIQSQREMAAQIKADFAELREQFKETDRKFKETDKQFKETDRKFKETDKQFKETDRKFKETDKRFNETDKRIKEAFDLFEGQWGKLMESLVEGDLVRILQERGVQVRDTSTRRKGAFQGTNYEFDIIAHNGNEIVIVEVKTTLYVKHVQKFLRRLEQVKTWLPEYKHFQVYGAVAFLRAEQESNRYAERQRLFVIKATGKSAFVTNAQDFIPKTF